MNTTLSFTIPRSANVIALFCVLVALPGSAIATTDTASAVEQYGITWHFESERKVGRYANGDWWVKGPVTITRITPESIEVGSRVINGSMLNARTTAQGYDSFEALGKDSPARSYNEALNIAPSRNSGALTVETGTVFSSVSLPKYALRVDGRPTLQDLALLTVVKEEPPADAFRPSPYSHGDKISRWRAGSLDFSILRALAPVWGTPSLSVVMSDVRRFWNEQNTNWTARPVHARNNQSAYGRDLSNEMGAALLSLHLDYANDEKRNLFIYLVQNGLDIYGRLEAGAARPGEAWEPNGGHNNGRKMPMILAGLALNEPSILARANREEDPVRFQEDGQTFYVSKDDVDNPAHVVSYQPSDVGMPEWAFRYWLKDESATRAWNASYRWIGSSMVGHALAAHLTDGAVEAWNWPPFFDYMDRYVRKGSPSASGTNGIQPFQAAMWDTYRNVD